MGILLFVYVFEFAVHYFNMFWKDVDVIKDKFSHLYDLYIQQLGIDRIYMLPLFITTYWSQILYGGQN